jgi:hypothetical protein
MDHVFGSQYRDMQAADGRFTLHGAELLFFPHHVNIRQ